MIRAVPSSRAFPPSAAREDLQVCPRHHRGRQLQGIVTGGRRHHQGATGKVREGIAAMGRGRRVVHGSIGVDPHRTRSMCDFRASAFLAMTSSVRYTWMADSVDGLTGVLSMALRSNHGVAVRPMTTDDIEFMVQLFLLLPLQRNPTGEGLNVDAIVQGTREATLEQARRKLKDSTTYVIEFDGQRVGRLRVVRTDEQIEIAGLQVLPAYQGRGIGTAVMTTLMQEGQTKALPVVLQVDKDNPDAKRLYLRLGLAQYGETHDTFRMRAGGAGRG